MNLKRLNLAACATILLALAAPPALAQDAAPDPGGSDEPADLLEAIKTGTVDFNLRLRLELADMDGATDSEAWTERIRMGYGTRPYQGLSFYIGFEDIRSFDDDRYNAAGLNAQGARVNVADPEDTELNRLFITYAAPDDPYTVIFGRQRIKLDDDRFIGNVGWRQNEQTFDAATVKLDPMEDVKLLYSFVWDVNRIFGPGSGRDFKSESHLFNASYDGLDFGRIVAFAYLLDLSEGAVPAGTARASDTYGLRFECGDKINDQYAYKGILSWATQADAGDNPADYEADYFLLEGALTVTDVATFGIGYEVLESDGGANAFQTPLATGHKFNGWADVFLNTPATGLEDLYFFCKGSLPWDIKGAIFYHIFESETGGTDLGEEIDIVLSKKINANWKVLGKFANFDGDGGMADLTRFWLQTEFTF